MDSQSWSHVLAVIVGTARPDGDAYRHFGSLLGFDDHARTALKLGLIEDVPDPDLDSNRLFVLTDTGRDFVERFRLSEAPAGRANSWHMFGFGAEAEAELGRLWAER